MELLLETEPVIEALAPLAWALIAAGIQAVGSIAGAAIQGKQAKDVRQEGDYYRQYGLRGMEETLAQRQQSYNNIWRMIYGGVSGQQSAAANIFGAQDMSFSTGAPTRGGTNPLDPRDVWGREISYGPRPSGRSGGFSRTGHEDYTPSEPGEHSRETSITPSSLQRMRDESGLTVTKTKRR